VIPEHDFSTAQVSVLAHPFVNEVQTVYVPVKSEQAAVSALHPLPVVTHPSKNYSHKTSLV
jgi:hypothetical protein